MDLKKTTERLSKLDNLGIRRELEAFNDEDLLLLLESTSIPVGDNAAELLVNGRKTDLVIDAILKSRIKTKLGQVRAANILSCLGRDVPRAADAYLFMLRHKSLDVISGGLFGLAFLQDKTYIGPIISARDKVERPDDVRACFDRAIEALSKGDPFIYSPHFWDRANVWKLSKKK